MKRWLTTLLVAANIIGSAGGSNADDVSRAETFVGRVEGSNRLAIAKQPTACWWPAGSSIPTARSEARCRG